jgi:hypothetical protein
MNGLTLSKLAELLDTGFVQLSVGISYIMKV